MIAGGSAVAASVVGVLGIKLQMGSESDFDLATRQTRSPLAIDPSIEELVRFATLAPNGHNTQPWLFSGDMRQIVIRPDLSRRTPVVDPDNHHIFVSLGSAAENLVLAAEARGFRAEPAFAISDSDSDTITVQITQGPTRSSVLFDAIPHRQSTRSVYDGTPVGAGDLAALQAASATPGVEIVLITERPVINRIRDLVVAGNSAQMADPDFIRELKAWLRFSPRHARETGDGLFSVASGNTALPEWLGPSGFDLMVTADSENDRYASQLRSSSGLAVFLGARSDPEHWVQVGRACQRFSLQATALGLKHAYINQPVEVPSLRPELAALVGMPGRRPDILMRFGYGPPLPYSARRPVEAVLA